MEHTSKFSKLTSSKAFMIFISFFGLYLLSTGSSWAVFSYLNGDPEVIYNSGDLGDTRSKIDLSKPKTAECPVNGKMYTEAEKSIWETRRPIAAVIENHEDSRPVEGLHRADIVYEAVAEGGVTRHLAIYYCGASAEDVRVAPIRSARVHFVNWAAEYGDYPIFVHVGGANNICGNCPGGVKYKGQVDPRVRAIEMLVDLDWRKARGNDFDTTYDTGFPVLFRDPERLGKPIATEHTMVSTTDAIFDQAKDRGFSFKDDEGNEWSDNYEAWSFVDESPLASPKASDISFEFWADYKQYGVSWTYDKASNSYKRINGGIEVKDLSSGEQVTAKNVVIQYVEELGPVDTEKHMFYKTVGTGEAIVFQNGDAIKATWEKESTRGRTKFYNEDGKEISFVRGEIWIEGIPSTNDVEY
ncbi:DUF3048 domain-containing protein [Candidatus Woesebacteria bacterium]|nr:MAG: DUF3048 domain-containing protein [Candidatus Woesebacteria bacterium]